MEIAIIGAGFSGCFLYKNLSQHNVNITLFEKARGTGGRLATKYINDKLVDHGTSSIKALDKEFICFLLNNVENGILKKIDDEFFPIKGMNKLCSSMIDKKDFIKETRIVSAKNIDNKWYLKDENNKEYKAFDKIFITIPSKQILQMDLDLDLNSKKLLEKVKYDSIATLICYSNNKINFENQKLMKSAFFKKIVNNSLKYNDKDFLSYVFHANIEFSNEHNELSKDEIFDLINTKIKDISGINIRDKCDTIQHLWKYALVKEGLNQDYIYNNKNIGICGDYFNGNNLESTFNSSRKLYEKVSLELV